MRGEVRPFFGEPRCYIGSRTRNIARPAGPCLNSPPQRPRVEPCSGGSFQSSGRSSSNFVRMTSRERRCRRLSQRSKLPATRKKIVRRSRSIRISGARTRSGDGRRAAQSLAGGVDRGHGDDSTRQHPEITQQRGALLDLDGGTIS